LTASTVNEARSRTCARLPPGTTPSSDSASTAASSTCSQVSIFRCSDQTAPISGRVIALDHIGKIFAASTAAFFAPFTATHATGTPGGICAIASRASSPPLSSFPRSAHADHRQLGVGGHHAGQRSGQPGARDDHAQAAHLGVFAYSATVSGSRCALITRIS